MPYGMPQSTGMPGMGDYMGQQYQMPGTDMYGGSNPYMGGNWDPSQ